MDFLTDGHRLAPVEFEAWADYDEFQKVAAMAHCWPARFGDPACPVTAEVLGEVAAVAYALYRKAFEAYQHSAGISTPLPPYPRHINGSRNPRAR